MERAITAVRDNVMGTLKASKTYNVPRSTLQRLAKKPEAPRKAAQTLLGRKTVLGEELETELSKVPEVIGRKTIINTYKLNRHIFSDANFIAEEIDAEKRCNSSTIIEATSEATTVDEPQHGCSKSGTTNSSSNSPNWCGSQDFISPFQIFPIHGIIKKTSNRGRKTSKSQIITSSPYRNELEISQAKPEADRGKPKLWQLKKNSQQMKAKGKKKQQIIESSGSEGKSEFLAADEDSDMDEVGSVPPQNADVTCMFCDSPLSQDSQGELWVCCLMCQLWAHDECAGAKKVAYVCDFWK
ncbi:CENP-B N-terminal DNA-binding domain [Popillia japonica]|uniref:CENP-B N-terminal DNA-binding domain n=1 Tax=Popillia japonica TaxID=7064 RepID=A0AAW1HYD7_POPJA